MITMVTVILDRVDRFLEIYLDWVTERTKLVSEVLLIKVDSPNSYREEWETKGIKFKKIGFESGVRQYEDGPLAVSAEHALAVHRGIEEAQNDYVMTCDPDIFFYMPVDEFYMNLVNEHEIDIIGISNHHSIDYAPTFFPETANLLFKKSNLPDENFLKGKLKLGGNSYRWWGVKENEERAKEAGKKIETINMDGKFLIPGAIVELKDLFPNPDGGFETASYLWLWANQQKWKWLSFQTMDCHLYTTPYNRGNIRVGKIKKEKLLYHATAGSLEPKRFEAFKDEYESSKLN